MHRARARPKRVVTLASTFGCTAREDTTYVMLRLWLHLPYLRGPLRAKSYEPGAAASSGARQRRAASPIVWGRVERATGPG